MKYNIVAGEELRKIMIGMLDDPIPFNEDMSKGSYASEPFTEDFIRERSSVHDVSVSAYREKLGLFLEMADAVTSDDEIHLFFGEDETCLANRELLIQYFTGKVRRMILHVVNEYTGEELTQSEAGNQPKGFPWGKLRRRR